MTVFEAFRHRTVPSDLMLSFYPSQLEGHTGPEEKTQSFRPSIVLKVSAFTHRKAVPVLRVYFLCFHSPLNHSQPVWFSSPILLPCPLTSQCLWLQALRSFQEHCRGPADLRGETTNGQGLHRYTAATHEMRADYFCLTVNIWKLHNEFLAASWLKTTYVKRLDDCFASN